MGTAGFLPQTLLRLGEANSLGRGQAGPAAGAVLPRRPPCCLAWTAALPWRTRPGGGGAEQPRARLCCLPGAAVPSVATAQLSPRRVRPGALVLYFVFVLPSPHSLETPSPCSHCLSPQQRWSCWTGGLISCVYPGQQDPKHVDPRTFGRPVNREERKQNSRFIFPPLLLNSKFCVL